MIHFQPFGLPAHINLRRFKNMSITSKVRQSVVLTADGQVQKLIAGSAANIGKANILSIFAQSTAADGEVKLYNEGRWF